MKKLCLLTVILTFATTAAAGTVRVAWDPVQGSAGYNVYYGPSPGNYTTVLDVGNVTETTLTGIPDCTDLYVAAKAYNGVGESPQFSNEISGWARPSISNGPTVSATQGDQFTLTVSGANFQPGALLEIDTSAIPQDQYGTPLVNVQNPSIVNCNTAQALVVVDPVGPGSRAMEVGTFSFDLRVTNPDGILGTRAASLIVDYDDFRSDLNRSDATTRDRVDGKDLAWLAYAHGATASDPRWNPDADLNGDGMVDGLDLALLAVGFGKCWTGSSWSGPACP